MLDNYSQATIERADSPVMGDYQGEERRSCICPIDQELVLYYRNGLKEPISELHGCGMVINDQTGSISFEIQGRYPDGTSFGVPQEQIQAVIDRKICKAVFIPYLEPHAAQPSRLDGRSSDELLAACAAATAEYTVQANLSELEEGDEDDEL